MKKNLTDIVTSKKVAKIKNLTIDLVSRNQITKHLGYLILKDSFDDKEYTQLLQSLCEKFIRVRGYYKKYKEEIVLVDNAIDVTIKDFKERR